MLCRIKATVNHDACRFKRLISFSIFAQRSGSSGSLGFLFFIRFTPFMISELAKTKVLVQKNN